MQRRVVLGLNDIVNSIGGVLNGAMSVWSGEAKANGLNGVSYAQLSNLNRVMFKSSVARAQFARCFGQRLAMAKGLV